MVKSRMMRKSLTIDEGTYALLRETQLIIHDKRRVDFDIKDIVHLVFSRPDRVVELIEKNLNM